jgi:hypothetical protein
MAVRIEDRADPVVPRRGRRRSRPRDLWRSPPRGPGAADHRPGLRGGGSTRLGRVQLRRTHPEVRMAVLLVLLLAQQRAPGVASEAAPAVLLMGADQTPGERWCRWDSSTRLTCSPPSPQTGGPPLRRSRQPFESDSHSSCCIGLMIRCRSSTTKLCGSEAGASRRGDRRQRRLHLEPETRLDGN